ncbi:PhoH family protein [Alkalihalobacillus sp. AL-G]|uniref:PhoH family protein n=1 Tax=Alkalihalobacillus sp. AL-G TaxID=2926399 RepID=UPI00272BF0B3|nr:PhoH family protein [Alkalihalobacillus sp. AL-G]WLD93415.1 PhoH family protein [Alkalihalobacillus sp. AL-G]
MNKVYILDTNVILHDPASLFKYAGNDVVIPAVVVEEIDSKKRLQDEVGRNAREFGRQYKTLREKYKDQLHEPFPLDNGGTLNIELNHRSFENIKSVFNEDSNDNRILAVAINIALEQPMRDIVMVSNDILLIVKADALKKSLNIQNFMAQLYENDRLVESSLTIHKGYHELQVSPDIINGFHATHELPLIELTEYLHSEVHPQDFLLLKSNTGTNQSALGRVHRKTNKFVLKPFYFIDDDQFIWGLRPKNVEQRMFLELLLDPKVEMVCAIGKAGTGKTLLALAAALHETQDMKHYSKVTVARPIVPMGKDIGYLPGEKDEKLRPWMQPIFDNLEQLFNIDPEANRKNDKNGNHPRIEKEIEQLNMEVEALTYIRGRSIPNQFIIIDEAQNLTKHEVKTIVSRAGKGTKIVLVGDPDQIDHPYLDSVNNGLTYTIERLKTEEEIGIIRLSKTERSNLAEKAARWL